MLSAPDDAGRPLFAAKDINKFYLDHCPSIFPQASKGPLGLMRSMMGPKYNGEYLHTVVKKLLGDTRVGDTLNNVVIPTFDIKLLQPTIFSTYNLCDAMKDKSKNALLSDVCISTSAAPTYLPGHHFQTEGEDGTPRQFNLIDGGVAANNPLYNRGAAPIIDSFSQASADLVDIHASVLFQALHCKKRYLRIQDDELKGETASVDVSTPENLNRLVDVGKALLKRQVCKVNAETGKNEPDQNRGTNEEELVIFARMLSKERKARLQKEGDVEF
ncbi:hypothetical protein CFC21_039216 [Triticum aestivum]|uniref:Patatin n=2 Tax=Triticum aestivum TaxID=4565 RepID=A0A9R1FEZ9_WHEAT|nr:hypothetical protein CFC21_039216 [Triticum aestivum]CDM80590.1 unnamed protein product [Triticum aestivum]